MDLPSSGGDALPMAKVPCEFRMDRPTFSFQGKVETSRREANSPRRRGPRRRPAAPDVIWHIYWGQCCFQGVAGMDLRSSGGASLIIPQVPSEFRANRPTFVFQGKMSRESAASRGMGMWSCRLQGVMPYPWPRSPASFERIGQPSFFRGRLRQAA